MGGLPIKTGVRAPAPIGPCMHPLAGLYFVQVLERGVGAETATLRYVQRTRCGRCLVTVPGDLVIRKMMMGDET